MTSEHGADGRPGAREREAPPRDWSVPRESLEGMSLGVAVAGAVASRTGANVLELDPLSEAVDVDALEALWRGGDGWQSDARVTFRYMDHRVTVTTERLHLEPLD